MNITKTKDYVVFKNKDGEYHFSHENYNKLGKDAAIAKAEKEIAKKKSSSYSGKTINFEQARELGFCEYGIKDFCERLNLDLEKDHRIIDVNKALTVDALNEYPSECIKLFGKDTLKYLGGVKGILSEDTIDLVLRKEFIPEATLHKLSVKFAYSCLDTFEKEYPDDKRPRQAIEAKEAWIRGDITSEQLDAAARSAADSAWSAADSAAWSAAWSAAYSAARSAADSAARSAADSAADSAARSAARSAADSAARKAQVAIILEEIENE